MSRAAAYAQHTLLGIHVHSRLRLLLLVRLQHAERIRRVQHANASATLSTQVSTRISSWQRLVDDGLPVTASGKALQRRHWQVLGRQGDSIKIRFDTPMSQYVQVM